MSAAKAIPKRIFVSVGTHPQQFDRLLAEVDRLAKSGKLRGKIFAQTGRSDYKPKNYEAVKFIGLEEFARRVKWCDLFITHGGEGNIGAALQCGKRMVIVPRLKKFGEHTNDHQLELTRAVAELGRGIAVYDIASLAEAVRKAGAMKMKKQEKSRIVELIEKKVREWKLE